MGNPDFLSDVLERFLGTALLAFAHFGPQAEFVRLVMVGSRTRLHLWSVLLFGTVTALTARSDHA